MDPRRIPWRSIVWRTMLFSFIFAFAMIGTNIVCCVVWEKTLPGRVYLNTDDEDGGGYLNPGGWVGSFGSFPVTTVSHVLPVSSVSMGDPDEIKAGWSIKRLLVLWGACSVLLSS